MTLERILVVDDIEANRELLCLVMEDEGYETLEAENGDRALYLVESENPDAILLDVHMPGMDGIEVCRRVKASASSSHIPIIMVSADSQSSIVASALAAGAESYIVKPFDEEKLTDQLRQALNH